MMNIGTPGTAVRQEREQTEANWVRRVQAVLLVMFLVSPSLATSLPSQANACTARLLPQATGVSMGARSVMKEDYSKSES